MNARPDCRLWQAQIIFQHLGKVWRSKASDGIPSGNGREAQSVAARVRSYFGFLRQPSDFLTVNETARKESTHHL